MNENLKKDVLNILQKEPDLISWFSRWIESNNAVCSCCGKSKVPKSFYYFRKSQLFANGRLPYCKRCLTKMFNKYTEKYNNPYKAIERICQICDLPYVESMANACLIDNHVIGRYIQRLNLRQNKRKRNYDDTKKNDSHFK